MESRKTRPLPPAARTACRVLLVDDSALARRMVRHILESAGYEVIEADDGSRAIERYAADKPDLVLLDLLMNGLHGLDVLEKLREADPSARVLVVSADIQGSSQQIAQHRGAGGFVEKPFEPRDILDAVEALRHGRQAWTSTKSNVTRSRN